MADSAGCIYAGMPGVFRPRVGVGIPPLEDQPKTWTPFRGRVGSATRAGDGYPDSVGRRVRPMGE